MRGFLGFLILITLSASAHAADPYPSRPIKLLIPFPPAGITDLSGRIVAEGLRERLKQPVVVENRPAAGGMVGADSVAKAAPDGHTLLLMETSSVLHKWLHSNVPFDVVADFTPIARVATSPLLLFANPAFAPSNARELIALAKAEPGKLSAGTPGVGTPHHLGLLMLNALAKIDIVNVPYRGAAAVVTDVLAGQVPMGWGAPTAVMPHVASGKLKLLGVASAKRPPSLPNVPTIAEGGVPGFDLDIWFGVSAPAKTPPALVALLTKEISEIVAQADVQERIRKVGLSPAFADGAAFREQIRSDHERFGKIIREAGIKPN